MSWLSEIAHDQGKVTLFAAIVAFAVGMTGSIVAFGDTSRSGGRSSGPTAHPHGSASATDPD